MEENQYGTAVAQSVLLSMMKEIHGLFVQEGISYSLCGGTLIGAIRHNGFIPWDDDIDIMVDRSNFNKILNRCKNWKAFCVQRDQLWLYRIKRIEDAGNRTAPTIDILVMDRTPDNQIVRKLKVLGIQILQGMLKEKQNYDQVSLGYKLCLGATAFVGKFFTKNYKLRMYDVISQIGNGKDTKYVTAYNDLFKLLKIGYDGDTMEHLCLHPFEDTEFFITEKYDSYLTLQYGDYMKLPNEEDRKPIHII